MKVHCSPSLSEAQKTLPPAAGGRPFQKVWVFLAVLLAESALSSPPLSWAQEPEISYERSAGHDVPTPFERPEPLPESETEEPLTEQAAPTNFPLLPSTEAQELSSSTPPPPTRAEEEFSGEAQTHSQRF
ncbi:MAG: hypothetical protein ACO3A2_11770 [Bdellovibrionia bacterium]